MADEGMNILFVPFLTDTQNGYTSKTLRANKTMKTNVMLPLQGCVGNFKK
jgi:hypothetical protein